MCGGKCDTEDASMYYPGVLKKSQAVPITLRQDEKRDDINFMLPR